MSEIFERGHFFVDFLWSWEKLISYSLTGDCYYRLLLLLCVHSLLYGCIKGSWSHP